ncbi:MAG TPA: FG-GAP repeat protein [Chthoniobacterales bacterium]|nr:FG-GAP repeat protein [Chthoniobacterales bacterium]
MKLSARILLLLIGPGIAAAAELHPIVEVQTGYLFGASSDGKWIKADEASKSLSDGTSYRVYGLTQALGESKGGKATPEDAPCDQTLSVSLSPKPDKGVIAIAAPWNALPRKVQVLDATQKVYTDAVRDFLKTKGIDQPKVKIDNIVRVDLDGDGEEEVLVSATNYLSKDNTVPMRSPAGSYSMVILRRVVNGKVETQLVEGEFHPKAYSSSDESSFDAPNAYKVVAVLDLDGDGKMEIVVGSHYYEGEATTIYRRDPKKIEAVLDVGCGA